MKDISKLTGAELGALIKLTLRELEVYRMAHKRWLEQDRAAKQSLRKLNAALKKKERQVAKEEALAAKQALKEPLKDNT
jgi:hypothetical protein